MSGWELAGVVVGVLVGAATLLGMLIALVLWGSGLMHEVKGIREVLTAFIVGYKEDKADLWSEVGEHSELLRDHGERIVRLEERTGSDQSD